VLPPRECQSGFKPNFAGDFSKCRILQRDFFEHDRAQQNGRTARRAGNSGSMSMCCKRLELRATEMECQELWDKITTTEK
jgi:hypothetical protein